MKRLCNEEIDKRLDKRKIKRIGNYTTNKVSIEWECLICKTHWLATPKSIVGKSKNSCHKCDGHEPTTNKKIDLLLSGRKIERISDCKRNEDKIEWKCLECGNQWSASPHSVIAGQKSGCPKCASSKSEKRIEEWLRKNKIKFVHQKKFEKCKLHYQLRFDFFLPQEDYLIEYNGAQHYRFKPHWHKTIEKFIIHKKRDKAKIKFAKENGYKLIVIPYTIKNIENYLSKKLRQ
jgi:hypothetical protein